MLPTPNQIHYSPRYGTCRANVVWDLGKGGRGGGGGGREGTLVSSSPCLVSTSLLSTSSTTTRTVTCACARTISSIVVCALVGKGFKLLTQMAKSRSFFC